MNNIKTNIIGAIAVIALLGVLLLAFGGSKTAPAPTAGATSGAVGGSVTLTAGTALGNGLILPNPSTFDYLVSRTYLASQGIFGLGNGSSVPTNQTATRIAATSGTSTPCAIQNPLAATSTISSFSMNITTATSTAITWSIGTSTSPYATSSSMTTIAVAATLKATPNWEGGNNNTLIGPAEYIVVGTGGGTAGTAFTNGVVFGATCQAVFQSAN